MYTKLNQTTPTYYLTVVVGAVQLIPSSLKTVLS